MPNKDTDSRLSGYIFLYSTSTIPTSRSDYDEKHRKQMKIAHGDTLPIITITFPIPQ